MCVIAYCLRCYNNTVHNVIENYQQFLELDEAGDCQGGVDQSTCTSGFISFSAIGFNVETVTYKNLKFQVWDLGGQTSIRYGTNFRSFVAI